MKAYILKTYGKPKEVLNLQEVDNPEPKRNKVLVKVHATTVNDYDWCITTGSPLAYRLFYGLFKPRKKLAIPGMELSGIVEKLGGDVTKFKLGDEVYGDIWEYQKEAKNIN